MATMARTGWGAAAATLALLLVAFFGARKWAMRGLPSTLPEAPGVSGVRLGTHFSLAEFVQSPTAREKGIDNTPTPDAIVAMRDLVDEKRTPHFGAASAREAPEADRETARPEPSNRLTKGKILVMACDVGIEPSRDGRSRFTVR